MEKAASRELCQRCEGIERASGSESEPDGNTVQGNYYEVAEVRNGLVRNSTRNSTRNRNRTRRGGLDPRFARVEMVD